VHPKLVTGTFIFVYLFNLDLLNSLYSFSSAFDLSTGCGRKNSPIWTRGGVGSVSLDSCVHSVLNSHLAWSGEHRAFVVKEFIQNGGSPIMMQHAFHIRFVLS
jgi:hypothetical protein